MCDFLVSLAAADAPILTPIVDRILVSVIIGIKRRLMDTTLSTAVGVVLIVVNLEDLGSRQVLWIGFAVVGKRRSVVL